MPANSSTLFSSHLSHPLMMAYLQEAGSKLADDATRLSVEALGRQMNVVGGPPESPWPKNVGLLLFNVVWFPEGAGGDRFDEKIFRGPLARMTRDALGYLQRNYLHETVIKHPDRAEATRVWNFPYAAVEEALVNAVYHRSYEEREPIEVRITRDELVVLSFPGPDRYRNRRLGEFLKELDLTEGRSTGIPKILKTMALNGSPSPLFETDDDRCAYVIRLPVHPFAQFSEATGEVTGKVTGEVERVLLCMTDEMTRKQLQDTLSLKHEDHFRAAYLLPALASGMIEMTLPDKPRSSKQQYRLPLKGRQWVKLHTPHGSSLKD